jgi:hypothetical protein
MLGAIVGWSLCFYSEPTYGLVGLWIGLSVGMTALCLSLWAFLLSLDWTKESALMRDRNLRLTNALVTGLRRTVFQETSAPRVFKPVQALNDQTELLDNSIDVQVRRKQKHKSKK